MARCEGRGRRPDPHSRLYAAFVAGDCVAVEVELTGVGTDAVLTGAGIVASIGTTFPFPIRLADFQAARDFGSSTSALFTCASSNFTTRCARDEVALSPSRAP